MRNAFLLIAASASSASMAQSRIDRPFHVELGLYVPAYGQAGVATNPGVATALGYSFLQRGNLKLSAEARGAFHHANDRVAGFGGDISISSFFVNGRFRSEGSRFFTGLGVGVGSPEIDIEGFRFRGSDEFLFAAEVGYETSRTTYVATRYQGSQERGLRGVTIGFGYRF